MDKKLLELIDEKLNKYQDILDYTSFGHSNIMSFDPAFLDIFDENSKKSFNKINIANMEDIPYRHKVKFKHWSGREIKVPGNKLFNDKNEEVDPFFAIVDFDEIKKIRIESMDKTWYLKIWIDYEGNEKPHSGADKETLKIFRTKDSDVFFKEMIKFNLGINSHLQPSADVEYFSNFLGKFVKIDEKGPDQDHSYKFCSYELEQEGLEMIRDKKMFIISELYKTTFRRKDMRKPYPAPFLESDDKIFDNEKYNKYQLIGRITNPLQIIFKNK